MNIITVTLPDSNKVFLIDDFFTQEFAKTILDFFKQHINDLNSWQSLPEFSHYPGRLVYTGNHNIVNEVKNYASSSAIVDQVINLVGAINPVPGVHFWADTTGYQIGRHYDSMTSDVKFYGLQVFFSDEIDYTSGTHFYVNRQPVLNVPLRQNYGYLLDRGDTVLHGLPCAVPPGKNRYSIHFKYQTV